MNYFYSPNDHVKLGHAVTFMKYIVSVVFTETLTLYFIILKNGQTYFKNLAVFTPEDF